MSYQAIPLLALDKKTNQQNIVQNVNFIAVGTTENVGRGTAYPVGISFSKFVRWYYGVKQWKCTFNGTAQASGQVTVPQEPGPPPGPVHAPQSTSSSVSGPVIFDADYVDDPDSGIFPIVNENDFLVNSALLAGIGFGGEDSDTGHPDSPADVSSSAVLNSSGSGGFFFNLFIDSDSGFPNVYYVNGLFYPAISISAGAESVFSYFFAGSFATNYSHSVSLEADGSGDASIDVSMDGESFSLPATFDEEITQSGPVAPDAESVTVTISVEITPSEYWTYDPGDGKGPIWDASSGEQLRDNAYQAGLGNFFDIKPAS